jgi:hypothetical protein
MENYLLFLLSLSMYHDFLKVGVIPFILTKNYLLIYAQKYILLFFENYLLYICIYIDNVYIIPSYRIIYSIARPNPTEPTEPGSCLRAGRSPDPPRTE